MLHDPNTLVHPVGGIADQVTPEQLTAFASALHDVGAIGGSLYDAATTEVNPGLWALLQQELGNMNGMARILVTEEIADGGLDAAPRRRPRRRRAARPHARPAVTSTGRTR